MGLGGISIWQLLIVLLIVVVIFGTKRLRGLGSDVGGAVKSFRKAMDDVDDKASPRITDEVSKADADFGTESKPERDKTG